MPVYKYYVTIKLGDGKKEKTERFKYDYKKVVDGIQYHRKKQGFETRDLAIEAEYNDKKNLGKDIIVDENILLKNLFKVFYDYKVTRQKPSTLASYKTCYKNHISMLGNRAVSSINSPILLDWKNKLIKKGMCQRSTNKAIILLKSILTFGSKRGYKVNLHALNDLDNVNLHEIKKERIAWTQDEMTAFFNSFDLNNQKEIFYYHFFLTLLHSGCRPSELRALTKEDIQGQYLNINKTATSKGTQRGTIITPPKTVSSNRKIIMPQADIDWLVEHTKDYNDKDFVFGKKKVIGETTIKRYLDNHIELSGISHGSPYNFRHTCATNMILNKVSIRIVSARLGHSSVSTTMNHYWHLLRDEDEKALDGLVEIK